MQAHCSGKAQNQPKFLQQLNDNGIIEKKSGEQNSTLYMEKYGQLEYLGSKRNKVNQLGVIDLK